MTRKLFRMQSGVVENNECDWVTETLQLQWHNVLLSFSVNTRQKCSFCANVIPRKPILSPTQTHLGQKGWHRSELAPMTNMFYHSLLWMCTLTRISNAEVCQLVSSVLTLTCMLGWKPSIWLSSSSMVRWTSRSPAFSLSNRFVPDNNNNSHCN